MQLLRCIEKFTRIANMSTKHMERILWCNILIPDRRRRWRRRYTGAGDSQPFRSRANSLLELSLPGAKWLGNLLLRKYIATYTRRKSSREQNGQGAKGPGGGC